MPSDMSVELVFFHVDPIGGSRGFLYPSTRSNSIHRSGARVYGGDMKALNAAELVSYCIWLRERLVGAQLQDLWTSEDALVLQFYRTGEIFVVVRLAPAAPLLWVQSDKPRVPKKPKPVGLFLASKARNLVLRDLTVNLEKGRTLVWSLGNRDQTCEIEMDLIPKSPNLAARSGGKQVSWNKPKVLPPPVLPEITVVERDWEEWVRDLRSELEKRPRAEAGSAGGPNAAERAIEKKRKAIEGLRAALESDLPERYRRLGDILKSGAEVPGDLQDLHDPGQSLAENIERVFAKAKDLERKKDGTRDRILILESEIAKLRAEGAPAGPARPSTAARLMKKGEAQGRKLRLENGCEAVIGKSGADNLAILRQARAWDLWVHLKDEPGAHAIIFRNRDQEVPQVLIRRVADWVLEETRGKKGAFSRGGKFEVLVVECRFVRPIKGDKLGRVTYQNPRVYTFAS